MAMLVSIIFKSTDLDEDDADEDEETPELDDDELWLYSGGKSPTLIQKSEFINVSFIEKSKRLGYGGLDEDLLEEMRIKRRKEVEMHNIAVELLVYAFFIWILLIISYGQRDPNAWYLQNSLKQTFIHPGALDGTDFNNVNIMFSSKIQKI